MSSCGLARWLARGVGGGEGGGNLPSGLDRVHGEHEAVLRDARQGPGGHMGEHGGPGVKPLEISFFLRDRHAGYMGNNPHWRPVGCKVAGRLQRRGSEGEGGSISGRIAK